MFPLPHTTLGSVGCCNKLPLSGRLKQQCLFLIVLEVGKSNIKAPAEWVTGDSPIPGFQMPTFLLCPHMTESRERGKLSSLSLWGTNPILSLHHCDLISPQGPHLLIPAHWGLGLQHIGKNMGIHSRTHTMKQFYQALHTFLYINVIPTLMLFVSSNLAEYL